MYKNQLLHTDNVKLTSCLHRATACLHGTMHTQSEQCFFKSMARKIQVICFVYLEEERAEKGIQSWAIPEKSEFNFGFICFVPSIRDGVLGSGML